MKKGSLILAILAGMLSIGVVAYADWVTETNYGDPVPQANWTDTVRYNTGLEATRGWANSNTTLSWNISYDSASSLYNYIYEWSTIPDPVPGGLSHLIIELTPGTQIIKDPQEDFKYSVEYPSPEKGVWDEDGNPLLSYGFYGAKITPLETLTFFAFSFFSEQEPVWGNFYAKDGGGIGEDAIVAWNRGLGLPGGVFIARPDGNGKCVPAPEPGTLMLLGPGLVGLWVVRRRK